MKSHEANMIQIHVASPVPWYKDRCKLFRKKFGHNSHTGVQWLWKVTNIQHQSSTKERDQRQWSIQQLSQGLLLAVHFFYCFLQHILIVTWFIARMRAVGDTKGIAWHWRFMKVYTLHLASTGRHLELCRLRMTKLLLFVEDCLMLCMGWTDTKKETQNTPEFCESTCETCHPGAIDTR